MRRTLVILFAAVWMSACSQHSGNFTPVLMAEIARYGGTPNKNAALPQIDAKWRIKRDGNGFAAYVWNARFSDIDRLLQGAFGTPKVSVDKNLEGQPHRVYGGTQFGVAIQCLGRGDYIEVVCIRPMQ